jgi:hypothetical protein
MSTAQAGRVEHFTLAERATRGRAARAEVQRSSHGDWKPAPGRRDPVDVLEDQARTRVPELVPDRAMASFAERYADQNDADYAALRHAVDAGTITAETGL